MNTKKEKTVLAVSLCLFTVAYNATAPPLQFQAIPPSEGASIINELILLMLCVVIVGFYFAMKKTQKSTSKHQYVKFKTAEERQLL